MLRRPMSSAWGNKCYVGTINKSGFGHPCVSLCLLPSYRFSAVRGFHRPLGNEKLLLEQLAWWKSIGGKA